MKYGQQFEKESAPQWSLHNIDYNSLKHHIKVHTTKDQATAIAIPGKQDTTLRLFEDDLYAELCRQHDRVDLFVSSKSDEIARRLQHSSTQIHRMLIRSAASRRDRMSIKRQKRFAKYENELLQCGSDIQSLRRFVSAQVVAFRKILKKYRKWTGSSTLGSRFRDTILSHPKSFTKRDFSQLQSEQDNLLTTLRTALPSDSSIDSSPGSGSGSSAAASVHGREILSPSETIVAPEPQHRGYWNEYDCGSEAGDADRNPEAYAIYIHPDEESSFPGISALAAMIRSSVMLVNKWVYRRRRRDSDDERGPLLPAHSNPYGTVGASYFAHPPGGSVSDTEAEDESAETPALERRTSYGYASSEEFPVGYKAYYAVLPSIHEQNLRRYNERMLLWGTWACFAASLALTSIAALLIRTGRHKLRLEVDAGVTLGIVASLGAACAGLGMMFSRRGQVGWVGMLAVWGCFATACVINGILLVLVVGNAPL